MIKSCNLILLLFWSVSVFSQEKITVDKIWNHEFHDDRFPGYSAMADGISYTYQEKNKSIVKGQFEGNGAEEVLFTPPNEEFSYFRYEFNSDESKILFKESYTCIFK